MRTIESDLEAYYDRRKEDKFLRILKEMQEVQVVKKLKVLGDRVRMNRSGDSIARAEFWSDTLIAGPKSWCRLRNAANARDARVTACRRRLCWK